MKGVYYLNNSGSKFVLLPKEKVLVFHDAEKYCKMRTIDHYEMLGNSAVACLKYKGKMTRAFLECEGGVKVFFIDYKEKYRREEMSYGQ
jgi:hypothetical protein